MAWGWHDKECFRSARGSQGSYTGHLCLLGEERVATSCCPWDLLPSHPPPHAQAQSQSREVRFSGLPGPSQGRRAQSHQALGMGGGDSLQAPPTLGLGRLLTREGEPPLELFWCLAASLCYEALARMGRKPVWNPARSH